jgi:hypothetical protein
MRRLEAYATCQVCGMEEDGHHAVIRCTKARALRQELRKYWDLPDELQFQKKGPEWLLLLLNSAEKKVAVKIRLLFWRAWFLRNDVVHGKGTSSAKGSASFLFRPCLFQLFS